ncbi:glycosyltransferase family 4 protein [Candidatus Pelagibacter communis]|uniref:glycosyltransferase family 4 protein n=1 Tax=Pelagibacter ubique TaxID=198252 RepID=UPI00094C1757|nr:glycosyltransferase family 4 protein [Candidatus Pelagibacter ubique]
MRIAFFCGVFFPLPGGAQIQTHNLANKLVKKGYKVDVIILNETNIKNNLYNIIVINKIFISIFFYIKHFLFIDLTFIFKIYLDKLFKNKDYDIFHFQFLNPKMFFLLELVKHYKKKIVATFHGADIQIDKEINYGYRLNKKYDNILKKNLKNIDFFFAISKNIENDLLDLGINKNKISIIPNSVAIQKFLESRNKVDLNMDQIKLLTIARFAEKKKGLDLIPKIAEILILKKISFKWIIVGKNSKNLIYNQFIKKNLRYFDFIENVQNLNEEFYPSTKLIEIFKKSDLYINTARIESFGVTIIESLSAEVPVITFNTKGGNELIKDNFNGKIIPNNSVEEMVRQIIDYQNDYQMYLKHKRNTLSSVKNFDLDLISKRTIDIYKNL